jgi:hypothetical protein
MISIWRLSNDAWELVEELQDDLALAQRLSELRADGQEYRAEAKTFSGSRILED